MRRCRARSDGLSPGADVRRQLPFASKATRVHVLSMCVGFPRKDHPTAGYERHDTRVRILPRIPWSYPPNS
jgi:hypothetical protein